jgi:hypothetical protein
MARRLRAAEVARWSERQNLWLDHALIVESDLEWMAGVRHLTIWNVLVPDGFLASLPDLISLDVRGGSGSNIDMARNCRGLQMLIVNQIRGLTDLSVISDLAGLRCLDLYGLPRVTRLPSLTGLLRLERINIGSMKGLESLAELLDAPALRELELSRKVPITETDLNRMASHPTLTGFYWFWEDVPDRVAQPVLERMSHLPAPAEHGSASWFNAHG